MSLINTTSQLGCRVYYTGAGHGPMLTTVMLQEGPSREEGGGQFPIRSISMPETYGAQVDSLSQGVERAVYLPDKIIHRVSAGYSFGMEQWSI